MRAIALLLTVLSLAACGGGPGGPGLQNLPPSASFSAVEVTGAPPSIAVDFDAAASSDADGTIVSYEWDFDNDGAFDATLTVPQIQFDFATLGSHTVRLRVNDDGGDSDSATLTFELDGQRDAIVKVMDGATQVGEMTAAPINGVPAAAYGDSVSGDLLYTSAVDGRLLEWQRTLVAPAAAPTAIGLERINLNPAIIYSTAEGKLFYVRASNNVGTAWPAPVEVLDAGPDNRPTDLFLLQAGGAPLIIFRLPNAGGSQAVYAVPLDANGADWDDTLGTISEGLASINRMSVTFVAGRPAACYLSGGLLYYSAASNDAGTIWNVPLVAADPGDVDGEPALADFAGRPAICYSGQGGIFLARALTDAADAWTSAENLTVNEGNSPTMIHTGSLPLIAYSNDDTDELEVLVGQDLRGDVFAAPQQINAAPAEDAMLIDVSPGTHIVYVDRESRALELALF